MTHCFNFAKKDSIYTYRPTLSHLYSCQIEKLNLTAKGYSEAVNRRTDNTHDTTIAIEKRCEKTNNGSQNNTQKTKDSTTRTINGGLKIPKG
jgi:hypothetical protein